MPVPRTLYLVIGVIAAPVGVCASAMAPVAGVLAGAIAVGLVILLGATGALLAADWRADQQSRQAWAEVAPVLAEWNPIGREEAQDIETRYRPALAEDVLREVFRLRRFRVPQVPAMELSVAPSAFPAVPTLSLPKGTACRAPQVSQSDGESHAGALVRNDPIDQTTLEAVGARPAKSMTAVAGRRAVAGSCATDGSGVRLAVNGGWNWPASDRALTNPNHAADVVVLTSCRDAERTRPAERPTETICATGTQPPNCRGPPALEQPRRGVAVKARRAAPVPTASQDGDLVVVDNLGRPVPVCATEIDAIETYLGDVLEELFASSKANSGPEQV